MNELPLPLNQLFLLNAIGYAVLLLIFWLGPVFFGRRRWVIDVLLVLYALAAMVGWFYVGMPNPMNLGYISKTLEIVMILALLLHMRAVTARIPWRP